MTGSSRGPGSGSEIPGFSSIRTGRAWGRRRLAAILGGAGRPRRLRVFVPPGSGRVRDPPPSHRQQGLPRRTGGSSPRSGHEIVEPTGKRHPSPRLAARGGGHCGDRLRPRSRGALLRPRQGRRSRTACAACSGTRRGCRWGRRSIRPASLSASAASRCSGGSSQRAAPYASPTCGLTLTTAARGRTGLRRRRGYEEVVGPRGRYVWVPEGKKLPPWPGLTVPTTRWWASWRALAWTRQHRRMSKDHERLPESSEAFVCVPARHATMRRLPHSRTLSDGFWVSPADRRKPLLAVRVTAFGGARLPLLLRSPGMVRSGAGLRYAGSERPPANERPIRRGRVGTLRTAQNREVRYRFCAYSGRDGEARCRYRGPRDPNEVTEGP